MEPSFAGFVLDPFKCSKLTMEEKRELVYQISKCSESAPKMLQSWSRRELLQILCAEMGKERKYTGLTKIKMIEYLLKVMSKRNLSNQTGDADSTLLPPNIQTCSKRQRKTDHPVRVVIPPNGYGNEHENLDNVVYCQNLACRAALKSGAMFCKRCSCCICYKYDDNKDPSLWLVCASEPPNEGNSCGMSCHLECALKNERAGILIGGPYPRLDGSFYCVSCQKVNDLLGCWRKQLMIAKDTRRVDTLCYRVFLSHRLLTGTEKYIYLHEIVDAVSERLEAEVGALDGLPVKKARGIVNRLSCGPEIQKLCASAVEMLDLMLSNSSPQMVAHKIEDTTVVSPCIISFEDVSPSSLTIVLGSKGDDSLSNELISYSVWHRNAENEDFPVEPTCTLLKQNRQFPLMDLDPSTDYLFKVVSFSNGRELEKWETRVTTADVMKTLPNPSSDGDESDDTGYGDLNNSPQSSSDYKSEIPSMGKLAEYACDDINSMMHRSEHSDPEVPGDSVSVLDEEGVTGATGSAPNSIIQTESHRDSTNSSDENQASNIPKCNNKNHPESQLLEEMSIDNEFNANQMEKMTLGQSDSVLLVTPCKQEKVKDGPTRNGENWTAEPEKEPQAGSSSKKRSAVRCEETCAQDESLERDYEYCVKVIRWLECEGHMEKSFRVKFLTWFSLRATPQERRIVSVYVDTLIDDPASLAGQLVDTFSEGVCRKKTPAAPAGFCLKLWH
ncbi:VIN3-like protein 2 isoform X2 [Aristolochia californica]|uniref:VIN3-like protein 2 isoform X2 n=1 Tax=Aristolochia californica TaxID=171875 RepID=UPI0035E11BB0